jgi:predicted nucleic acid-binding protein
VSSNVVLIDTSIWIEAFRSRESSVVSELQDLLEKQRAVTVGQVIAEVLYGCRNSRERAKVQEAFGAVPALEIRYSDWIHAGDMGASLRTRGTTLPLSDLVIASVALREDAALFTLDKHFQAIPHLSLYSTNH